MISKILTFVFVAGPLWAGTISVSLEEAPSYALRHNPQIAAAAFRIDEARGRLLGSGRRTNPDLEIGFSQNIRRPERAVDLALMQRFPVTGRLSLEKAVSRAELAVAEAEVLDGKRKLAAEVRAAAIKFVAIRAQRELRKQQLSNSREQSEFVTKRIAAGEASTVDAAQIDLESRQLEVELLQLDTERVRHAGDLRLLLGVSAGDGVEITGMLPKPAALPKKGASGEGRPDLAAARHNADAAQQAVALARARKWEDIGVGLTGTGERMEDAPDGFSNDYFLGFKLSVPLPFWNKNEGRIAETTAAAARADKEIYALSLNIRAEAEGARGEMAALAKLIVMMDDGLLPKAAEVEAQLRASYGTGQTQLPEVLRARARTLELSQRRADALRDYHLARARYDAATGGTPSAGGKTNK